MAALTLDNLDIHSTDLYLTRGYPFEEGDLLRREAPVFWYEREGIDPFYAVTRHEDILTIYTITILLMLRCQSVFHNCSTEFQTHTRGGGRRTSLPS